jgi:hypothetical protein
MSGIHEHLLATTKAMHKVVLQIFLLTDAPIYGVPLGPAEKDEPAVLDDVST